MVYKPAPPRNRMLSSSPRFHSHTSPFSGHKMDAVTLINKPCRLCGKTTAMWCGRCQNAWYCSPEHLQSVRFLWGSTRPTLTLPPPRTGPDTVVNAWRFPPPPTPLCQRANVKRSKRLPCFLRPAMVTTIHPISIFDDRLTLSSDGPRTVEVSCAVVDGMACPAPIVQSYFTDNQPYAVILTQGLNGEPLRYPLHIFYCPQSLSRGSPVNNAIKRMTGGVQAKKPWCGPVLVMKFNGSRRQGYSDATSSDFTALSAYFLAYK